MKLDAQQPIWPTVTLSLAMKLGSIAVHADEATGDGGHHFDVAALRSLLDDKEVREWIEQMGTLLPRKR